MRTIALALVCMVFVASGERVKVTRKQMRDGPYAEHQKSQNAGNSTPSSDSLAELEQSNARAGVPNASNAWKWLALLLLAGNQPADALALHKSRLFIGRGQLAPGRSSPEAAHSQSLASNKRNDLDSTTDFMGFGTSASGSSDDLARENARAGKANPTKLMQLPKFFSFSRNGDPEFKGTLGHLPRSRRLNPVMNTAVLQRPRLVLERAPPAPPPPPPSSRGRDGPGGGDDDGKIHLRRLSESQALKVLDYWIGSTRVYCMSGQFDKASNTAVVGVHRKSLEELELLRSFTTEQDQELSRKAPKLLVALYASDKETVLALAGGGVLFEMQTQKETLVIKHVSVSPFELNKESSTAAPKIKEGLRLMASGFGADLILPENNDGK